MQFPNFIIEILTLEHAQFRLDYYCSNRKHLEVWHPTTPKGFYTFKYQKSKIKKFEWESSVKNYLKIYEKLVK